MEEILMFYAKPIMYITNKIIGIINNGVFYFNKIPPEYRITIEIILIFMIAKFVYKRYVR